MVTSNHTEVFRQFKIIEETLRSLIASAERMAKLRLVESARASLLEFLNIYEDICSRPMADARRLEILKTYGQRVHMSLASAHSAREPYEYYPSNSLGNHVQRPARHSKDVDSQFEDGDDAY